MRLDRSERLGALRVHGDGPGELGRREYDVAGGIAE